MQDPASDLYSLGMTLVYLITGQHPADLQQQDMKIQFEQGIKLKPSFSRWLRKMTELNLERRYSSSREALQALKHPHKQDKALPSGRPKGSDISLTKSADELQIIIPSGLEKYYSSKFGFAKRKKFLNNQAYILEDLNVLELNWLANELSDWLEIPIKYRKMPMIEYSTDAI